MTTQQHSSGPWEYRGFTTPRGVVFDISQSAPGDADVAYTYSHPGNARLIAAAPELLEACEMALVLIKLQRDLIEKGKHNAAWNPAIQMLASAIAKATGAAA